MAGVDMQAGEQLRLFLAQMEGERRQGFLELLQSVGSGRDSRVVSLEDGTGGATGARVTSGNNLGVDARYGDTVVVASSVDLSTTSAQVLGAEAGRLSFTLQNLDSVDSVHFRLGGGTATTSDLRLDPGQMFSLPSGVAFDGIVTARAAAGSPRLSIVEYKVGT